MSDVSFRLENAFHNYAWGKISRYAEGLLFTFTAHTHISMDPEVFGVTLGKDEARWKYARWKRNFDMKRIESADPVAKKIMLLEHEPSIVKNEGALPKENFKETIKAASELSLSPLSKDGSLGLDGSSFSIRFGDGFRNTTYHWWEELPYDWQTLKPVLEEIKRGIRIAREGTGFNSEEYI